MRTNSERTGVSGLSRLWVTCWLALSVGPLGAEESAVPNTPGARPFGWTSGVFRWHYNPDGEPPWLALGEGLALFTEAARQWAPCGPKIAYLGLQSTAPGQMNQVNVLGWRALNDVRLRGMTWRRQSGGSLLEADVGINSGNPQLQMRPLLRKVVMHEFGHALGLVHSPDCQAIMSFGGQCGYIPVTQLPQQPTAADWLQCRQRYGKPTQ